MANQKMRDSYGDGGLSIGNTPEQIMENGGSRTRARQAKLAKMMGQGGLAKAEMGMDLVEMMTEGGSKKMYKKGGPVKKKKKQGYNSRLDESLGMRNKGKKKQSMKSRRNESKGMKKSKGKKAYSANRSSAQGKKK